MMREGKAGGDLNMEKDGKKLWRLTKQLNDEGSRYSKITLIQVTDPLA